MIEIPAHDPLPADPTPPGTVEAQNIGFAIPVALQTIDQLTSG